MIVALVVAGDLVIIVTGTIIPISRIIATRVPDEHYPRLQNVRPVIKYLALPWNLNNKSMQEDGITFKNFVYICLNSNAIGWLAVSYAYKGLLQLVAMFMAFHTRRVKIKALNDSKETAVIVYINSITLALLTVVEFALINNYIVHAALFGLGLLVGPTVFLMLVFVPRVISQQS